MGVVCGYSLAANRLDDYAKLINMKDPKLANKMRVYGHKCDAAYLSVADDMLDIKGFGPVSSYLRATGKFNPDRLDMIGGPWQDRKDYAGFALMMYERMKRNDSPELQKRSARPCSIPLKSTEHQSEVQWSVWGEILPARYGSCLPRTS